MKTTIMEYGLTLIGIVLLATFFAGFMGLIGEGGSLRETIVDFIQDIC